MKRPIGNDNNPAKKPNLTSATLGNKQVTTTSTNEIGSYYFDKNILPIEILGNIFSRCCTNYNLPILLNLRETSKYLLEQINEFIGEQLTAYYNPQSAFNGFPEEILPNFENAHYKNSVCFYKYSQLNLIPACALYIDAFKCKIQQLIEDWSEQDFKIHRIECHEGRSERKLWISAGNIIVFNYDKLVEKFIYFKILEHFYLSDIFMTLIERCDITDDLAMIIKTNSNFMDKLFSQIYEQLDSDKNDYAHIRLCIDIVALGVMTKSQETTIYDYIINSLNQPNYNDRDYYLIDLLQSIILSKKIELNNNNIIIIKKYILKQLKIDLYSKLHRKIMELLQELKSYENEPLSDEENIAINYLINVKFQDPQALNYHNDILALLINDLYDNIHTIKLNKENIVLLKCFALNRIKNYLHTKSYDYIDDDTTFALEFLECFYTKKIIKLNEEELNLLKDFCSNCSCFNKTIFH